MAMFDTTPRPSFLLALRNTAWTISGAISELVDNSFGVGRGNASRVVVTIDQKQRTLRVLDDGDGITDMTRLFQLGNTQGRVPGDIGKYGVGGTMALLWIADSLDVWSLRNGRICHALVSWKHQIEIEEYPKISDKWDRANAANTPHDLWEVGHGTVIHMRVQPARQLNATTASNTIRDLQLTYAPALRGGKEIIWKTIGRNGGENILTDPLPTLRKPKPIHGMVEYVDDGKIIHLGFNGLVGTVENLPHAKSNIAVGYRHRVIASTRDCYSSPDGSESFAGVGVCGFIDLHDEWCDYLSTTKTAISHSPLWDALMGHIFAEIRALLKSCEDERMTMLFDDIASGLNAMFSQRGELESQIHKAQIPDIPPGPHLADRANVRPHQHDLIPPDAVRNAKAPAIAGLKLYPQSDDFMQKCLCIVNRSGDLMEVWINKEHPDVQEAMKSRPANFRALAFLVTSHVAEFLIEDEELCKSMFRKHVYEDIAQHKTTSLVMRHLLDRLRAPQKTDA